MLFLAGLFMVLTLIATSEIEDKDIRTSFVMILMALTIIFTAIGIDNIVSEALMSELQTQN